MIRHFLTFRSERAESCISVGDPKFPKVISRKCSPICLGKHPTNQGQGSIYLIILESKMAGLKEFTFQAKVNWRKAGVT